MNEPSLPPRFAAPVRGRLGQLWRTITLPVRLVAPFAMLARRFVGRRWWQESTIETPLDHPEVKLERSGPDMQPPAEGSGALHHRTYEVVIIDATIGPAELIDTFRRQPNRFSPTAFATFVPDDESIGLTTGNQLTISLPGPWDGPVVVGSCDDLAVRLETREGHLEAGWIEFRARGTSSELHFVIESVARSGDEAFDVVYSRLRIGRFVQTEMWVQVLEAAAAISGGTIAGRCQVSTTSFEGTPSTTTESTP